MNFKQTTAVYFSPTATSKRGAQAIAKAMSLDATCASVDFTMQSTAPTRTRFGADELVVFGLPVYGGRLYKGSAEALGQFCGEGTPCILTVTYGNRHYDDALIELADIATAQGFVPVAAAALIGEHTFGAVALGRPNESDIAEDIAFAEALQETLAGLHMGDFTGKLRLSLPGNRPYKDGGNKGNFLPNTLANCIGCKLCAKRCTMGAIDLNDVRKIDAGLCISCFRCIKNCPVNAKVCDDENYLAFAEGFTKRLAARRENEFFLPLVES